MSFIFAFAIKLMNRLRYPQKFALLGLVALLAIGILLISLYQQLNSVIIPSQQELTGLEKIKSISTVVQLMQQHRGMSSAVLSGNEEMKPLRAKKEQELASAVDTLGKSLPDSIQRGEWVAIAKEWETIRSEGLNWKGTENIKRHTNLIESILILEISIADHFQITLDPEIDSFYLLDTVINKLPEALERMGQMRARGTALLTKKEISDQDRVIIGSLLSELGSGLKYLKINLDKSARYNPAIEKKLQDASKEIATASGEVIQLVRDDILTSNFKTPPKQYFDLSTAAIDKGYQQMFQILLPAAEKTIHSRLQQARWRLWEGVGIALLVSLVFAWLASATYLSISQNLATLEHKARALAKGDLSIRITLDTQDELQAVASSFNLIAKDFGEVLQDVQQGSDDVANTAQHMTQVTGELASAASQQSQAAANMASTVEELTTSVAQISDSAQDTRQESQLAGTLSNEGSQHVDAVVHEITHLAEAVQGAAKVVEELGQHSHEISAIINVIKEIAEQTNLLALNAAIEAARAGETGRGFAVVADEVRKLAERTAQSTHEITRMISTMQNSTKEAVASMHEGVQRVDSSVALARNAGESMVQIRAGSARIVSMVNDISNALSEQSLASHEIASNIERIAQMAEENNTTVGENADTAQHLASLAERLRQHTSHFKF